MSNALEEFIVIADAAALTNDVFGDAGLDVDFTRTRGDYLHHETPRTSNGLGRCLPAPSMSDGAKLSISFQSQRGEIYFGNNHKPSRIIIRGSDGRIKTSGLGPSAGQFKTACDNSNLQQRQELLRAGKYDAKTSVRPVFDELKRVMR